jgi:UDP-glucose 4-epimerase
LTRLLVTGATTPYGIALCRALLERDEVEGVVAVGLESREGAWLLSDPRYRYVATDLTRSRNLRDLLWGPAHEVDCVLHAAAHRSARGLGRRAHRLHVDATRLLLQLVEEHPRARRVVFRSDGAVYRIDNRQPAVIDETSALELEPRAPQWIRDRVAADLTVCTRMGMSAASIAVLRFAECLAPLMGSQLYDYLTAPVCFRPLGFDPMINVISVADMVAATVAALCSEADGIFNVPGLDTLPLSLLIRKWGHRAIPAPGRLLGPLYRARSMFERSEFRYDMNHWRFHFNGTLSGERAERILGYHPRHGIKWPIEGLAVAE